MQPKTIRNANGLKTGQKQVNSLTAKLKRWNLKWVRKISRQKKNADKIKKNGQ